ncbi:hypothetical protein [Streptomyces sp. 7N604]|uniref:hypothetical protein n=1 Tax=Streptomyces sp. 7N604 TaxID=3457415 RepID=UPI003FD30ED3
MTSMFQRRQEYDTEVPAFWKQRGWVLSAAFFAVVLIMSIVAFLVGGDGASGTTGGQSGAQATTGPFTAGGGEQPGGRPAGCRTDDSDDATPKSAPEDVRWEPLGAAKVPASPSAGPLRKDGPVRWCFARTPLGAVMAAHLIPVQMSGDDWRTITEQQVVPGTARDIFSTRRGTVSDSYAKTRAGGSFSGFSVASYSPDSAKVRLLIKGQQGGLMETTVSMRWTDGDWKVEPGSDGSLYSSVTSATAASGFIMWRV